MGEYIDVKDGCSFRKFIEKKAEWNEWLYKEDEVNNISRQLALIKLDYVLFLTVLQFKSDAAKSGTELNHSIMRLFEYGTIQKLANAIRRMNENLKSGKSEVISIKALLNDIRKSKELITRENYVASFELPYDLAQTRDRYVNKYKPLDEAGIGYSLPNSGPYAYCVLKSAHEGFDKLSSTQPDNRKRKDQISDHFIDKYFNELDSCNKVKVFVDKFIAHSSSPSTRKKLKNENLFLSLDAIEKSIVSLFRVANSIDNYIFRSDMDKSTANLPNPWKNIQIPFVASEDEAQKIWSEKHLSFKNNLSNPLEI